MASLFHRFPAPARAVWRLSCLLSCVLSCVLGCLLGAAPAAHAAAPSYRVINLGSGSLTELPAINAHGQVAYSLSDASGAFAWFFDGRSVHNLGTLGGPASYALGLNDEGQVAGFADTGSGATHAFRWSTGTGMVDLGAINGGPDSFGAAINDAGTVVGWSDIGSPLEPVHAFQWTAATGIQDLGSPFGDFLSLSMATAINNAGIVAGNAELGGPTYDNRAFVRTQATGMVDLGTLGGSYSYLVAIDAKGDATGWADVPGGSNHAFFWMRRGGMRDLGTAGGTDSFPLAMSAGGQVVGVIDLANGFQRAFSWTRTRGMTELGTLGGPGSRALGVNNNGQVVGTANTSTKADPLHAFLWSAAGGLVDLNTRVHRLPAGLSLVSADAIADDGSIVAETNTGLVLLKPDLGQEDGPALGPILGPEMIALGAPFAASAGFADDEAAGPHSVVWTWGDGASDAPLMANEQGGAGSAGATHVYTRPGVYTVRAQVTDQNGHRATVGRDLVVVEPSGGVAAGIGTVVSPPGAIGKAPARGGKARFAFYAPGPGAGQDAKPLLLFSTAGFAFRSEDFRQVAAQGGTVRFAGSGRTGRGGVAGFSLSTSAGVGDAARFALKVWHTDPASGAQVVDYDSQLGKNGAAGGALVDGRIAVP